MPRRFSVNRRKKVLRTLVGDSTVDKALREVYDRLDELQPEIVANESPLIPRESVVGSTMLATNDQGEYVLSVKTSEGWMTDINSKLVPIMKGFKPSLGLKSHSNNPIKNEALLYDSLGNIKIEDIPQVTSDTDKFLLSDGGTIKYVTGDNLKTYIGAGSSNVSSLNDLSDVTYSDGDLTITSLDTIITSNTLVIDSASNVEINADGGFFDIKDDTSSVYRANTSSPVPAHFFYNTANNSDYLTFTVAANGLTTFSTVDNDGTRGNMIFSPNGKFVVEADMGGVYIDEISAAGDDVAGDGQLWVKDDAPNNLYFTDDAGNDIALTNNGKSRVWSSTSGGYKTNNNSATSYYFQYYPNYHLWSNADSSPTSISYTDAYSYQWCANAPGILTNISVTCRATDTGTTDPLKFYVYKGQPGNNVASTSLTLIGTTGTITPVASRQMFLSTDISSSNDFAAGDKLWVMYKKDSTSGNQDLYFAVTISGEYT
jgi:hypothetical protein